ncbi:MAG: invasin domain 3-containing protein, partial [Chloroflexota bacterium]
NGEVGAGTIILDAPAGFSFDTGGTAATVLVTRTGGTGANTRNINDVAAGTSLAITSITASTVTFVVTAASTNSVTNSLTWQNLRVRPTAGTPLASGNITKSGTSAVAGITNGSTNLGTLTQVAGATVAASPSTVSASPTSVAADGATSSTITVTLKDQFGNPKSGKSVTLANTGGATGVTIVQPGTATNASGVTTGAVKATGAGDAVITATDTTDSNLVIIQTATVTFSDTTAPTVSGVTGPANASYRAMQNLDFTVNFSENVTVDTTGGTPDFGLTVGATPRTAGYFSGSGTSALVFRHTVQAGDNDADGIASAQQRRATA